MFCKYCGKELDERAAFCPNCGAKNDTVGETAARATVNETAAANHSAPSDDKGKANKLGIAGRDSLFRLFRSGWGIITR